MTLEEIKVGDRVVVTTNGQCIDNGATGYVRRVARGEVLVCDTPLPYEWSWGGWFKPKALAAPSAGGETGGGGGAA